MSVKKVRRVAKRYLPLGVLVVIALSLEAFAADVAFYPFTEGAAGSDAIGTAVRNAVDSSTLGGSVSLSKGMDATATFLDDVPGRYLYTNSTWTADSIYRSDVYQSVQLSWVTNKPGTVASGATVSFADLGPRLAGLDAWTVEFFFKFDELLMSSYRSNVVLGDDENIAICLENKYNSSNLNPGVRAFCGDVLARSASATLSSNGENGKAMLPGLWHHLAVSYRASDRQVTTTLDYEHSGTTTCTNENTFATKAFELGNGLTAARFAALRVTDRVLSADEMMRASDMPPSMETMETRFHWSFEAEEPGQSLGTVQNDAAWRRAVDGDGTNQYTYAVDGKPPFAPTGDGVVNPLTYSYTDESIGTLVMDNYASNVTDVARAILESPDGELRDNKTCAFTTVGPKNKSSDTFGKGPTFRMSDTNLLSTTDFTAETYWKPDVEGWWAVLGNDASSRYRSSIFGVKGTFRNDVANKIPATYLWNISFNMNTSNFNFMCLIAKPDGTFADFSDWNEMGPLYRSMCNDGKMHHYAVVYRVSDPGNDNNPTVRFYIDRTEGMVYTLSAPIVDFGACYKDVAFVLGAQELNNHPMQGWFDEVRYTARALSPSEFLKLSSCAGTVIVIR